MSSPLLRKPAAKTGKIHDITPESAEWKYVGFSLYNLAPGDDCAEFDAEMETILVLVEGKAEIQADRKNLGELGQRMSVFERIKPHCVYIPNGVAWSAKATTKCMLAVCRAPGHGNHPIRIIDDIGFEKRGHGANTRFIHPIAMEDKPIADSLLVTEVYTPQGNWSSYPPHRHDEDNYPEMTYLEETYYHRFNPSQGFGFQRVYTEDGELDETMAISDQDLVLVPKGHHPCGAPYGYEMYYLNVMAGPLRKWRFKNDPAHEWIVERDVMR
jgi:5-deoxy-glucuronate isomerase